MSSINSKGAFYVKKKGKSWRITGKVSLYRDVTGGRDLIAVLRPSEDGTKLTVSVVDQHHVLIIYGADGQNVTTDEFVAERQNFTVVDWVTDPKGKTCVFWQSFSEKATKTEQSFGPTEGDFIETGEDDQIDLIDA